MWTRCHVLIYSENKEFKYITFQPFKAVIKKPGPQMFPTWPPNRFSKWNCVNYFIIFLICSDIKLSSSKMCEPYERWDNILYPDIWFTGFICSSHGDLGPSLQYVNLVKSCQDPSSFLVIVGGNSKGAFLCIWKAMG